MGNAGSTTCSLWSSLACVNPALTHLQWKTVRGRNPPPVDLSDRDQLYDAQIVAVCREHGVNEILSEDRDFTRFNGIHLHTL